MNASQQIIARKWCAVPPGATDLKTDEWVVVTDEGDYVALAERGEAEHIVSIHNAALSLPRHDMKHITGSIWQTLSGRHNIVIESRVKSIAYGLMADDEALELANELTTIATRISQAAQSEQRRAS